MIPCKSGKEKNDRAVFDERATPSRIPNDCLVAFVSNLNRVANFFLEHFCFCAVLTQKRLPLPWHRAAIRPGDEFPKLFPCKSSPLASRENHQIRLFNTSPPPREGCRSQRCAEELAIRSRDGGVERLRREAIPLCSRRRYRFSARPSIQPANLFSKPRDIPTNANEPQRCRWKFPRESIPSAKGPTPETADNNSKKGHRLSSETIRPSIMRRNPSCPAGNRWVMSDEHHRATLLLFADQ